MCMRVCACARLCVYVYVHVCVRVVYVRTVASQDTGGAQFRGPSGMYMYVCARVHTCVCVCVRVHICTHVCVRVYTYVYIDKKRDI